MHKNNTGNKFWFDDGCTARGKEKRLSKGSRDPHTPLAARSISQQARWLRAAKRDNEHALERLTAFLGEQIQAYGKQNHWQLRGRHMALAEIVLEPFVHAQPLGERESAKRMGICRSAFLKNWTKKIEVIRPWVQQWASEIGEAPILVIVDHEE